MSRGEAARRTGELALFAAACFASAFRLFLSRSEERIEGLLRAARSTLGLRMLDPVAYRIRRVPRGSHPDAPLWTDDYSDLLGALKR